MRPRFFAKFLIFLFLVAVALWHPIAAAAEQNTAVPTKASAAESEPTDVLQKALDRIAEQRAQIRSLEQRKHGQQEAFKKILEKRLDRATLELLDLGVAYAKQVAAQSEDVQDLAAHRDGTGDILTEHYQLGLETIADIRAAISLPAEDLSGAQMTAVYADILESQELVNGIIKDLVDNLELSQQLNIASDRQEQTLKAMVDDIALARSILLEIETQQNKILGARIKVAPDDTELKSKFAVVNKSLKQLAGNFSTLLDLMDGLTMDTNSYREQILNATGTISADTAEIGVVKDLLVGWGESLWTLLIEDGPDLLFKALLLTLIILLAFKVGNLLKKLVEKGIESSQLQVSELLRRMIVSMVRNLVVILGVLIALSQMGISLGPLLAGFGIIGFVIGFALQDSLSNFASGFMILIYRPYDVGDIIESGGVVGRVNNMSFVNTTIITFDNQSIIIPNSKIWNDVIKNVTSQTHRRVDMAFGIAYNDNIEKAETVLMQIMKDHDKILDEPEPIVKLHELGDSSVNFIVRPWVLKEDYWEVYWDVTRTVKLKFDEAGLSIPFPQRDVHLYSQGSGVD